ncbi:hypothetical protein [Sedimentitalea sp.]|uniref:COG3904 family protein n=1 Tax=Sedimentitalea sp. TaxID=2048915 RepID=UPI00329718C9
MTVKLSPYRQFPHSPRSVAIAIALTLPAPSYAQDWGRWQSGSHEFAERAAWVNQIVDGQLVTMDVLCAADIPYVAFTLDGLLSDNRVDTAILRIGSQTFEGEARYRSTIAEPAWAMVASDNLVDALKNGSAVEVAAGDQAQTFALRGSDRAIEEALAGCGTGQGYHPTWTTFFQFATSDAAGNVTYADRPTGMEVPAPVEIARGVTSDKVAAQKSDTVAIEMDVEPMRFSVWSNGGNCYETCKWISAEGLITDETPAAFERFISDGVPAVSVYIDSPGGRLVPALTLGRRFRELGLSTSVGTTVPYEDSVNIASTAPGNCQSACAYMFLGGVSRSLNGIGMSMHSFEGLKNDLDQVLGFHGVSLTSEELAETLRFDLLRTSASGEELAATGSLLYGAAEFSSGIIVEYLTEMGIDARLLQDAIASDDDVNRLDMKFPSNERLNAFGVFSVQEEEYGPFLLQIVGEGLVATAMRRGIGTGQNRRATLRLVRACEAPTPWIVYTVGPDSDQAASLSTVMAEPAHRVFTIKVGDAEFPGGGGSYGTAMFSRINDISQVHRPYIEAFGGTVNQFGDLYVPSFASNDAFTIFVPLSDGWRALVGAGTTIEWSFDPRVNSVPKLLYTFEADDLKIAERVNESCLSTAELALIRY